MTKWGTNATYEAGQVGGKQVLLLKGDAFKAEGCPSPILKFELPECVESVDIQHEVEEAPTKVDGIMMMVTIWGCQGGKFLLLLPDDGHECLFNFFGEKVRRIVGSSVHAYCVVTTTLASYAEGISPSGDHEVLIVLGATRDGQRASRSQWMNRRGRDIDFVDTGWALHEGPLPFDQIFDGVHVNTCRWRRRDLAAIEVIDDNGLPKGAGREDETTDEAAERLEADPQPQVTTPDKKEGSR